MNLAEALAGVHWPAVVVATLIAFALGGLWYSKPVFGGIWLEEVGLTEDAVNSANMPMTFGGTFFLQFVAITGLSVLLGPDSSWLTGLQSGLMIGIFWIATAYGITYLFEQRSIRLFMINAGYNVILFAVCGIVLGAWQ